MQVSAEDERTLRRFELARLGAAAPAVLLASLLVLVALQRGGYYAESWGLPTAVCGWIVAVVALRGTRERLRRLELVQLAGLSLLGVLALGSAAWAAGGLGSALPETQLLALYAATVGATLMLFRRATPLVATVWAALVAVSMLALGTRLFPNAQGADASGDNRLYQPLGYWNSLGLWAAMGLALGLVLAGRSHSLALRAAAAASCVPCAATLYFTFSRGAWVALAVGLLVAFVVDPGRLGLAAWGVLVLPWPAVGILLASRSHGLTTATPALEQARQDGRSLAGALVVLSIGAAVTVSTLGLLERRWPVSLNVRRAFAALLVAICTIAGAGTIVKFGAPWTLVAQSAHRFAASPPRQVHNLNARLFDASGSSRLDLWRVAWDDAGRHPLVGSGAGSYAAQWFRERPSPVDATNAHQLYLETLAELGPLGLGLLLTALGAPLVAGWRARRHPLMAGVLAAYVAFLVHAAADWDWQLAAVGLAGLACGATLLVMARGSRARAVGTYGRAALAATAMVFSGFALWSLHGAYPLAQARNAVDNGQWVAAQNHARTAIGRIGGSSAVPWQLLGEAQTALRKPDAARVSLRVAVRRDPSSWEAWYDLAVVSHGAERRTAANKALTLNPLGTETLALAKVVGITPSSP
ncbi:MAG: O-antigen ligase family protein [Actinomycetota bacterium]|nr:O-antigen ligase family protein [Actinomycetota bacterium]